MIHSAAAHAAAAAAASRPRSSLPPRHPVRPSPPTTMPPLQLPIAPLAQPHEFLPLTPGGPKTRRDASRSASASPHSPRKITNPIPTLVGKYRAFATSTDRNGEEIQWEQCVVTIEKVEYSDVLLLLTGSSSVLVPRHNRTAQLQPEMIRVPFCLTGAIDTRDLSASMAMTQTQGVRDEEKFEGKIELPEGGAEREWQLKLRCGSVACSITLKWIPDSTAAESVSCTTAQTLSAVEPVSTSPAQAHVWQLLSDPNEGAAEEPAHVQLPSRIRSNSGPSSRKYQVSPITSGNVSRASSPAYSTASSRSSSSPASASSSAASSGRSSPAAGRAIPPRLLGNPLFKSVSTTQVKRTTKKPSQVVPWM